MLYFFFRSGKYIYNFKFKKNHLTNSLYLLISQLMKYFFNAFIFPAQ